MILRGASVASTAIEMLGPAAKDCTAEKSKAVIADTTPHRSEDMQ
jgi:hypothetical protein